MDFIKQLFLGVPEEWVHERFIRYGRGVFDGPVAEAKIGGGAKVSGSEEYCNVLGLVVVSSCRGLFSVSGSVVGKKDFRGLLEDAGVLFKDKSKKGFYSAEVSGEFSSDALKKVYVSCGEASVLLFLKSADCRDFSLKCKKKLPKPGGGKDSGFVSASLGADGLKFLKEELFFDVSGDFTEAMVEHKYNITELVAPPGLKDPARIRLEAKRKGFVERRVVVDGREAVSKKDFLV